MLHLTRARARPSKAGTDHALLAGMTTTTTTAEIKDATIIVYHGGKQDDPRWYTTDLDHAGSFGGTVQRYAITGRFAYVSAADITDASGYSADDALYEYLAAMEDEYGVGGVVVDGWEGSGVCVLIADFGCHVEAV